MRLLVISPTAVPEKAERMMATARRVGIEPLLYGLASNHPHGKDYQGTDIVEILSKRRDAEFVMGVDAPDVAFLAGEDEILAKLLTLTYPMLMSCEREGVSGLDKTKAELFRQCQEAGGYHAQPNIGGWIGKREYALHVFNEAERVYKDKPEDPAYSYDNHFQWLAMLKAWGGGSEAEFHLDHHCRIFQSMNQADTEWLEHSKRLKNVVTGTFPCVLHYNGDPTRVAYSEMVERILQ